ncbi:hypothetical protein DIPPA_32884 [Diplonema papillatum]|nr:hypothetical protein DIPPA_32884 [Diplonema papillatum]
MSLAKWVVERERCEALEQAVAGNGAVTKKQALVIQAEVRDKNKAKDAALRHGKKGVEWCEIDKEKIVNYVRAYGLNGAIRQWSADGNERPLSIGGATTTTDRDQASFRL